MDWTIKEHLFISITFFDIDKLILEWKHLLHFPYSPQPHVDNWVVLQQLLIKLRKLPSILLAARGMVEPRTMSYPLERRPIDVVQCGKLAAMAAAVRPRRSQGHQDHHRGPAPKDML